MVLKVNLSKKSIPSKFSEKVLSLNGKMNRIKKVEDLYSKCQNLNKIKKKFIRILHLNSLDKILSRVKKSMDSDLSHLRSLILSVIEYKFGLILINRIFNLSNISKKYSANYSKV